MKLFRIVAIAALVCGLSAFGGCATNTNTTQAGVFGIQQQYNHALAIGVWYGGLESCTAPVHDPIFCSNPDVVKKIKDAKDVASPAIQAAQATVRNPAFDASTASKVTLSAKAALSVLTAITIPLEDLLGKAITAGKAQPLQSRAEMRASRAPWEGRGAYAAFDVVSALLALQSLLKLLPFGTGLYTKYKADETVLQAIVDRGNANPDDPNAGKPTDAEWATLNGETAALEKQIDENAAAASGT